MTDSWGDSTAGRRNRAQLRAVLLEHHPWLADEAVGPATVEAGECDTCAAEARLVGVCGPGLATYLGRRCALVAGVEAWCAGHEAEALVTLDRLAALPAAADHIARLWWVACGEVRVDPPLLDALRRVALPPPGA